MRLRRGLENNLIVGTTPSHLGRLTTLTYLCVVRPPAARPLRPLARQPTASPAASARSARVRDRSLVSARSCISRARAPTGCCRLRVRRGLKNNLLFGLIPSEYGQLTKLVSLCVMRPRPARFSAVAPSRTPAHRLACRRRPARARPSALNLVRPIARKHARTRPLPYSRTLWRIAAVVRCCAGSCRRLASLDRCRRRSTICRA